jgi:hypothetical protein
MAITFENQVRRLQADLTRLGVDVANKQRDAVRQSLRRILPEMRANAPVETGATKRALAVHSPSSSLGRSMSLEVRDIEINGRRPYWYAPYEDARRPWFSRIWSKHEQRMPQYISDQLEIIVEKERQRILESSEH